MRLTETIACPHALPHELHVLARVVRRMFLQFIFLASRELHFFYVVFSNLVGSLHNKPVLLLPRVEVPRRRFHGAFVPQQVLGESARGVII